jgi:hypothetical protein
LINEGFHLFVTQTMGLRRSMNWEYTAAYRQRIATLPKENRLDGITKWGRLRKLA